MKIKILLELFHYSNKHKKFIFAPLILLTIFLIWLIVNKGNFIILPIFF